MSELDPNTGNFRAVSEAQIIEDFKKYEGISIERLDDQTVQAIYQEYFGQGSVKGESVLNVLLHAVRAQKNYEYWRGYHAREDAEKEDLAARIESTEEQLGELTESINQLKEAMGTGLKHLASSISHPALQYKINHDQEDRE